MPDTSAPRVAFITLGCPKNEVDTDRMRAAVSSSNFALADDVDDADVVVVNTCSFIREATEESIEVVLDLVSTRTDVGESRRLIVAGCMPSRYGADLGTALPEVDAFLPVAEEAGLLQLIEELTGHSALSGEPPSAARTAPGPSAYLQVSDGCHRACAYCTIPAIRGPYRSRPMDDLVSEATALIDGGAKEIVLIGQDITAYGRDLDANVTLAEVVHTLAALPGLAWLRLMYAQPDGITRELLAAMAAHDSVCNYLDMPLQHASGAVLKRMRRRGNAESYLALLARIRSTLPDVVLRTTLIAGFPGETREDARLLQRFLEDAAFDYVGVFPYSREDGTPAATMEQQIPARTRRARAQRLRDISDRIGEAKVQSLVGSELDVLVEGVDPDDGVVFGRWAGQAPEIDGVVLLDRGAPGDIVRVRIIDALGYDLEGEVI